MPYTPVNFQDGVTPLNAATLNKLDDALEDLYTNPAAALTYEGDYVPATPYQDGDVVVKDGIAYLCVGGPTTQAPNPVPGPAGMMSGYIKTTDRGAASGVAPLDASSKVPMANLYAPYPTGLATLDANSKVPQNQLPGVATHTRLSPPLERTRRWGQPAFSRSTSGSGTSASCRAGSGLVRGSRRGRGSTASRSRSPRRSAIPVGDWERPSTITRGSVAIAICNFSAFTPDYFVMSYPATWPTGADTQVGAAAPWTWAPADEIQWNLWYEVP